MAGRGNQVVRAFTLIELVIVIGVIIVLLGLTIGVARIVQGQSEVRETQNTLTILDSALNEWASVSDRSLSWGRDNVPLDAVYDVHAETTEVFTVSEVLDAIGKPENVRVIIARINQDFVRTYESGEAYEWLSASERTQMNQHWGLNHPPTSFNSPVSAPAALGPSLTVLDAWGKPIRAVHPGRVFNALAQHPYGPVTDVGVADPDGTVRTAFEDRYGVAQGRKVYFVSAGPDGQFGNLHLTVGQSSLTPAQQTDVNAAGDNVYSYEVGRERPL
jgi:type II secretory pathway pseudopilin PulG